MEPRLRHAWWDGERRVQPEHRPGAGGGRLGVWGLLGPWGTHSCEQAREPPTMTRSPEGTFCMPLVPARTRPVANSAEDCAHPRHPESHPQSCLEQERAAVRSALTMVAGGGPSEPRVVPPLQGGGGHAAGARPQHRPGQGPHGAGLPPRPPTLTWTAKARAPRGRHGDPQSVHSQCRRPRASTLPAPTVAPSFPCVTLRLRGWEASGRREAPVRSWRVLAKEDLETGSSLGILLHD